MPTFTYRAMDANSRFITGEIEAADLREVARELEKLGYVALDTVAGKSGSEAPARFFTLRRPVGRRDITVFLRELALVLRAGLTLDEALLLLAGEESVGLASIMRDLRTAITAGASFAEALERHPRLFGADLAAMVRVAEATGNLAGVLESVGEERTKTERMLDKISSALRYPAVLLVVALSVLVFFMVAVVPQFASVLRDFGKPPEGFVGGVLAISDFLVAKGAWLAAFLALAVLAVLIGWRWPRFRLWVLRRVSRLPGLRGILELRRTVLFCSGLGTLLSNGVTLTAALRVMVGMPGAAAAGLDAVVENVRRGGRLVDALGRVEYIPPLALKMLRVGEESGELATVARRTAEFYETKLSDRLDRLAGIVGPVAIVAIAAIVGTLIVSILSALLSVNQLIG
jgi:general secretion pathway protein F